MRFAVRVTRAIVLFSVVAGLSACGTGNQQPVASASTNSLTFSVTSPDAATPAPQTFTASVSPGTVSVAILHGGSAVANATYTLSGNTAQVVVDPASPSTLGSGVFNGTVTVTGYSCGNPTCSQLVSGNSQVITVTYNIPSIVRYVAPYIGVAGASGSVIIQGQGFEAFPVQNVTFGGISATNFSVVSDTQIDASFTGLTVGTYLVQVVAPSCPGPTYTDPQANLVVVPETTSTYVAGTIPYPPGVTGVSQLLYDAERKALLLVADTGAGPEVLRYAYSGSTWSNTGSASPAAVPNLVDIALSTDGNELLALSAQALAELNPGSLGLDTTPVPAPGGVTLKNLAVANNGYAVVTTGNDFSSSSGTPVYLFAARSPAFSQPATAPSLDNATPGASADGSLVALQQGDPSLASTPPVAYEYAASSGTFAATSAALNQSENPLTQSAIAPVLDQSAVHIVLNGTSVFNNSFGYLGALPSGTLAVALSPDSNCAYTFDSSGDIVAYNLNAGPVNGTYVPVGSGTSVSPGTNGTIRMAITPDGGTLFIAGSSGIVVQPAPLTQCQ